MSQYLYHWSYIRLCDIATIALQINVKNIFYLFVCLFWDGGDSPDYLPNLVVVSNSHLSLSLSGRALSHQDDNWEGGKHYDMLPPKHTTPANCIFKNYCTCNAGDGVKHLEESAICSFLLHKLSDTHDWLVLPWLIWESKYGMPLPPKEHGQFRSLGLPATDSCAITASQTSICGW